MQNYKIGKTVQNPRSKLVRVITKVGKKISWKSKLGNRKGSCSVDCMNRWMAGMDNH